MGLFTAPNPDPPPSKYIIHDEDGLLSTIDKAYADTGTREGWLEYLGAYMHNGYMIYNYIQTN